MKEMRRSRFSPSPEARRDSPGWDVEYRRDFLHRVLLDLVQDEHRADVERQTLEDSLQEGAAARFVDAQKMMKQMGPMMGLPGRRKATKSPKNKRKGTKGGNNRPRLGAGGGFPGGMPQLPPGLDPSALGGADGAVCIAGADGVLAATDCGALDAATLLVETGDLGVALDDI